MFGPCTPESESSVSVALYNRVSDVHEKLVEKFGVGNGDRLLVEKGEEGMEQVEEVVERVEMPSLMTFQSQYMDSSTPLVICGGIEGSWKAMECWNRVEFWKRTCGWRTVPVEIGGDYRKDEFRIDMMSMGEYVDYLGRREGEVLYLAQHELGNQIPELQQDIVIPDFCVLGSLEEPIVKMWIGPSGTVTPLHSDPYDNLLCQVVGSKLVRLISAAETEFVYAEGNTSQVDMMDVDEQRFPLFGKATCLDVVLKAGEMLFIPKGWWHFVESQSVSVSVSFWF
eukprot:TRINITY_DN2825_c0_g2_i1.p1 TRINITY_DN2825_c0_g2~~TRINITY_DN2825_c0_g2_i1.p1  ORF type:complete len:282 (-),score=59.37 TRINITY_DN2825_c0_g2_i1:810-1655(-)